MAFLRRQKEIRFSPEVYIEKEYERYFIRLSDVEEDNYITLKDNEVYEVKNLSDSGAGNKGGHSIILRLFNPDNHLEIPLILKICVYTTSDRKNFNMKKLFDREVIALKRAKDAKCQRVINILENGELFIDENSYKYYVMEYAESDLSNYLIDNDLDLSQRLLICYDLLIGIQELHRIGVYHRDIKHDNLLICKNQCKLADLGLARFQNDESIELHKKLGAYGWEAPEAINKFYTERDIDEEGYVPQDDCIVDNQSDIYQVAKVFWYIFNDRIPVGQIVKEDFTAKESTPEEEEALFTMFYKMLMQDKAKRITIDEAIALMKPLLNRPLIK